MIRQVLTRYSSQWPNGALMYPGLWVETWIHMPRCGTWMLLGIKQHIDAKEGKISA